LLFGLLAGRARDAAAQQLEVLISSLRASAQDTLAALQRRGFRIARDPAAHEL